MIAIVEATRTSGFDSASLGATCPHPEFAVWRLPWSVSSRGDLRLPLWKGSMLHGSLGWALADIAQAAPVPEWPGLAACSLAQTLCEPQLAWNSQRATAPWSLRCADPREVLRAGEPMPGELLLYGEWPAWSIALLTEALQEAGRRGLTAQRVPVHIDVGLPEPAPWPMAPSNPTACTMTLRSPCRLKDRGGDCATLHPPAIVRSLLRRSHQLHQQLVGGEPPWTPRYEELSHACDALYAVEDQSQPVELARWSNRQERHVRMDALAGSIRLAGATLPLLAPWLAAAPLLHLGRQPTFGWGEVEVRFEGACQNPSVEPVSRTP